MRNIFDQYEHHENRLTHALAVCLNQDRTLLSAFLDWLQVKPGDSPLRLTVQEQRLPGDPADIDIGEPDDRAGLPDIVIHDEDRWCLIIENKITAAMTSSQITRHRRTIERRGFDRVVCAAITLNGTHSTDWTVRTWSDLYEFLGVRGASSAWASALREYLRVAELRGVQSGYLTEGTLTMFDGFPFSTENPYTYGEAKRLLRLALNELRNDKRLLRLGVDPDAPGRGAIRGRKSHSVWDFLSLSDRARVGGFTKHPHLTLAVHTHALEVAVTLPNGVARPLYDRFASLGVEGLAEINREILARAKSLIDRGGQVVAAVLQRHYLSQSSPGNVDVSMSFRLETGAPTKRTRVKYQPEWLELFAKLPSNRRSNLQFQYRVMLPWGTEGLDSREALGMITDGWIALEPFLNAVRGTAR